MDVERGAPRRIPRPAHPGTAVVALARPPPQPGGRWACPSRPTRRVQSGLLEALEDHGRPPATAKSVTRAAWTQADRQTGFSRSRGADRRFDLTVRGRIVHI